MAKIGNPKDYKSVREVLNNCYNADSDTLDVSASLEVGDIEIGAVELKDSVSDTRAVVKDGSSVVVGDDALVVADANVKASVDAIKDTDGVKRIVDNVNIGDLSAGTQTNDVKVTLDSETVEVVQSTAGNLNVTEANSNSIKTSVELIDDAVGTIDSAFSGKVLVSGAKAESGVPVEVSDADAVAPWFDTFGRQVISGANLGLNAIDVNDVSPALLQSFDFLALDAVTATGASNVVNCLNYSKLTFYIIASSVSSGATVKVQSSPDNVNWFDEDSSVIGTNGITKVSINDEKLKYVRVNVTDYTDGTFSVYFMGGN